MRGLGLFGFDLSSSAETELWWREEEEVEEKKSKLPRRAYTRPEYMASTWGQWLLKQKDLNAANDGLDHACREARDFASHFRVSYHGSSQARVFRMYPRRRGPALPPAQAEGA